jgi:hypothetical protein
MHVVLLPGNIIFEPVKRRLSTILFSLLMLVIIDHEAIHHYHLLIDEDEIIADLFSDHDKDNNPIDDHGGNKSFPQHEHVFIPDDLISDRNNFSCKKEIKFLVTSIIITLSLPSYPKSTSLDDRYFRVINVPQNPLPFIISPNAMRGSPCSA